MEIHIIFAIGNKRNKLRYDIVMFAPKIEYSTPEERLEYVQDRWRCLCNCELCGKCNMLRGRNAENVYEDYIAGRRSYMDITLELRNNN